MTENQSQVVWLKNGLPKDSAALALVITHPRFEIGNSTEEDMIRWFQANVDREKTPKIVQRHFLKLAWRNIKRLYTKTGKERKSVTPKPAKTIPMQWVVSAKIKAWRSRLDAILDLGPEYYH
ncbi:MAG: hypothetical protein ACON43_02565 [Flavobacteriaceae bacterium]